MTAIRFPRPDYAALDLYNPGRRPVEVDLSDNTNLWGTHPEALEVVRRASIDDLARYPSLYADEFRAAVAEVFGVQPDQVATGAGSDDILDSLWRAVCESGGLVTWPAPTFSMMEPLVKMNGRRGRGVPWSVAMDRPEALLEGDPVLVYICRPNNPTGALTEVAWIERLADLCEAAGTVLLIDEAYADFALESLAHMAVSRKGLLVVRTMSKAFGMAGMRVGFAIGTAEVIAEIEKSRGPYKVGRLDGVAAAAALRDQSGWARDRVAEAVTNRKRLADELTARGFDPLDSAANFLFVPVPTGRGSEISEALRDREVSVRPFLNTDDWGDALRVTVGPWEMMERFLNALDEVNGASGFTEVTGSPAGPSNAGDTSTEGDPQ